MGKWSEKIHHQRRYTDSNSHVKECTISFFIKKLQNSNNEKLLHTCTPIRMAKIETDNTKC